MQFHGVFKIGRKENIRYNLFVSQTRLIVMTVVVFVLIAVMLGVTDFVRTRSLGDTLLFALPLALGGSVLFIVLNTVMLIFRVNKSYKEKTAYEFTQDITIDESGVHATSERGRALLEWSKIEKVREAGHAFYLFLSKTQAYVLPKYQLANRSEDAAQIRALLRQHLDAKLLKLK